MRETDRRETQTIGGDTLAMLAHDLRTPMCSVAGAAQMALMAAHEGRAVDEQIGQILQAVQAMDALLAQLCSAPRTERIRTGRDLEHELRALMLPRVQQKRQTLDMDLSALGDWAIGREYAQLERALLNLLSNAVKYTPEGGRIELKCAVTGKESAVLIVRDNGMGMKRDFLQSMYRPFARAKESAHLPGTGLGLTVVRRCVKEIGGSIRVKSEWGKGTEFILRLPMDAARSA